MTKLKNEYTDIKNIKHTVRHLTLSADASGSREQILEEIRSILEKQAKKSSGNSA